MIRVKRDRLPLLYCSAAARTRRRAPCRESRIRLVLPILVLVGFAAPAAANWQDDLTAQLRWDEDCKVQFFTNVVERQVEGHLIVVAKAHCEDGRVFDALQRNEFEDFEINECTPDEQAC